MHLDITFMIYILMSTTQRQDLILYEEGYITVCCNLYDTCFDVLSIKTKTGCSVQYKNNRNNINNV